MARRPHVPKFGNWDANDHMPFTAVFDNARHGRGKPINPNDPSDNSDIFGGSRPNAGAAGRRIFNPNDPEDVDASDLHHQDRPGSGGGRDGGNSRGQPPRTGYDQQVRRQGAPEVRNNPMPPSRPPPTDYNKRQGSRENLVTDRHLDSPSTSFSADQSPPHAAGGNTVKKPAGAGMVGGGSPAWERKKSSGEEAPTFAPATPTRSRLRAGNTKPEDSVQKGSAALPKFGAWNQDPGSGDGFTVIFNQARNEKKAGGPVRIPQAGDSSHGQDLYNQEHELKRDANKKWFCCFWPVVNA